MTSRKILRYMRELRYQYRPAASRQGMRVFRRQADGAQFVLGTWAACEKFVRSHPQFEQVRRRLNRHAMIRREAMRSPQKYRSLVKAGVMTPKAARMMAQEESGVRERVR